MQQRGALPELEAARVMKQLLSALNYSHSKKIVHRDLKPENILVNSDNVVKICDFGSGKIMDGSDKNTPYIVSRYYRAPELLLGISSYDTSIDMWATGCIIGEFLLKRPLFPGKTEGS